MEMKIIGKRMKSFKGKEFLYAFSDLTATWHTHEDEERIREEFWDIKSGDIILDVGCGFGSYTLSALALGAKRVYCWTPLRNEISLMVESLRLNGWVDKVVCYRTALYSRCGSINPDTLEFSDNINEHSFRTDILDNYLPSINMSDGISSNYWIKMDVEGAEVEILKGSVNLLQTLRPKILIENHIFKIHQIDVLVKEFLEKHNYTHYHTIPGDYLSHSLYLP